MTTYNESDHNRDERQRYADKPQSEPSIDPLKPAHVRKPGEIGGYEVRGMKTLPGAGMEGPAWTATIYFNGKREIAVSNTGDGGDNRYGRVITARNREETLEEAVKQAKIFNAKERAFRDMAAKAFPDEAGSGDGFVAFADFMGQIERDLAKHPLWDRSKLIEIYIQSNVDDAAAGKTFLFEDRFSDLLRDPDQLNEA